MKTKLILALVLLTVGIGRSAAQILVDSLSITQYVQDVLLGNGVQATNISFTGCLNQIGYMQGGSSTGLGIDGGVVLSSDHVRNIEVPSPFLGIWDGNCAVSGDAALLSIANSVPALIGQTFTVGSVNDVSILEFDFVPTGDTLRFNYIFGSDEYLEWVNSTYNDIFAFLLSGPGITGPYGAPGGFPGGAVNIAQLPGTNPALPITVSSVNNAINPSFYIDNFNNENISIDGYTVVLEAMHPVQCGQTYHIKLAIADGTDTALESIVILEEGSFSSNAVVDVNLTINVGGPDASVLYEDCGEATISFTRAEISDLNVQDIVVVTWGGGALMGPDYNIFPDTIVFPIGVSTVSFSLDAFEDGLLEGLELVNLDILNLAACNGSGLVSNFQFWIDDEPEPLVVEGYDTAICLGASAVLEPIITGGYGNFHFDWSTNETTETIEVSPIIPTTYFLTVSDTCGMPSDNAQFLIDILIFDPLSIQIDNGNIQLNCNEQVVITATAAGGDGIYSYAWTDANGNNLFGFQNTMWYGSWNGPGEVNVTVADGCGFEATDVIDVTLNVPELFVDVPSTVIAPCNQLFTVTATPSGGEAPYWYSWTLNGVNDWNEWDNIFDDIVSQPSTLVVTVNDNCGQSITETIDITIDSPPINLTLVDDVLGTCATVFNFAPTVGGGSGTFQYQWTENGSALGQGSTLNFDSPVSTTVNLLVTDACGAEAEDAVIVTINNPELFVDLGADLDASCLDLTELTAGISGGSGGNTFQWVVNGSEEGQAPTFEIQAYETVQVNVIVIDACGETANDEVVINIPDIPLTILTALDTTICRLGAAYLWAMADGGEGGFTYQWPQIGSVNNEVTISSQQQSGTYTVIATDQCGKVIEDEIYVEVRPIEASFSAIEIAPSLFEFTALTEPNSDGCTYIWDLGDGATSTEPFLTHQYDGFGIYVVTHFATNSIGCTDFNTYTIFSPPIIYIPNAFTPNGDGINDVFGVEAASVRTFEMHIFNRWGEQVFSSDDPAKVWLGDHDGAGLHFVPDGVYMYVVKLRGFNSEALEKTGNIVLTR